MKVLMLGWEFAPIKSGGLGVACRGIARGLNKTGVEICFVMPSYINSEDWEMGNTRLVSKRGIKIKKIMISNEVLSAAYGSGSFNWEQIVREKMNSNEKGSKKIYGRGFWKELDRYTEEAIAMALENDHDIIHAHDWMTYKAGEEVKKITGKPLVVHVHATEMDRTAGHPNPEIYAREKRGLFFSDRVIVVSDWTKQVLVRYYGIDPHKIEVVHNAVFVEQEERDGKRTQYISTENKIVLFLGRVTIQKGPEQFVKIAQRVLEKYHKVKFVLAGSGDMLPHIIDMIVDMGLQNDILCAGFLTGDSLDRALYSSNVYVMPSVSEPFGLSALEAVEYGVPVVMSKTSGAAEVLHNSFQAEFWDVDKMANEVIALLKYPEVGELMVEQARKEIKYLTWHEQAKKIKEIYDNILK